MTDPGLNHRLRQRSRRAGVMIGISMALTIAVCVGSFSVLYASLDDFFGDFVSRGDTIAAVRTPTPAPEPTAADQPADQQAAAQQEEAPAPTQAPEPTVAPTPTEDPEAFTPDYQLTGAGSVNFREGPGRDFGIVTTITLEQPLQFLDETAPTENPEEDGDQWMKFRTEDGQEGWLREIDVSEYVP
jgi:hypothetical protein